MSSHKSNHCINFSHKIKGSHEDSKISTKYTYTYRPGQPNADSTKNVLILKNPQFLPNHNETLLKGGIHVYLIFTKFHNNWVKIVDFLI